LYSGPEIRLGTARLGRDTLAAIAEELSAAGRELTPRERVRALARAASSPEIAVRETLAGRETLGAIAQELREVTRPAMNTKPYGDRISNAPGARTPSAHNDQGPEISVGHAAVGRETLAAINGADELLLYNRYKIERIKYYQDLAERKPALRVFLKGWMNRIQSFPDLQ